MQLSQFASAYALASAAGRNLELLVSPTATRTSFTWEYRLDSFELAGRSRLLAGPRISEVLASDLPFLGPAKPLAWNLPMPEPRWRTSKLIQPLAGNRGWHSLIQPYLPEILRLLDWKRRQSESEDLTGLVGLHVRLGDYLTSPIHLRLGCDYYQRALARLGGHHHKVVLFSDQPQHAQIFFDEFAVRATLANVQVFNGDPDDPLKDLIAMTNCSALVAANSSFSLWAARLSCQPRNIVAPRDFFSSSYRRIPRSLLNFGYRQFMLDPTWRTA